MFERIYVTMHLLSRSFLIARSEKTEKDLRRQDPLGVLYYLLLFSSLFLFLYCMSFSSVWQYRCR